MTGEENIIYESSLCLYKIVISVFKLMYPNDSHYPKDKQSYFLSDDKEVSIQVFL